MAGAVVTAIERNRGGVDVAPLASRILSTAAGPAPEFTAGLMRRLGMNDVMHKVAAGQRDKR